MKTIAPEWIEGVPWCRQTCPAHTGKPGGCRLLAPKMAVSICIPAVRGMSESLTDRDNNHNRADEPGKEGS